MSEEMMIRHCSPTLAGMKTGNIFTCTVSCDAELHQNLCSWNRVLRKKGLRVIPLRYRENRAIVYVYRPGKLSQDLQQETASRLLRERGYQVEIPARCISHLRERLGDYEEFPHEIGLFLGYPPEDVCGFIENRAKDCKCVGCWKVYGDVEAAEKTFAKYKKCTDVYCAQFAKGRSIERLIVAEKEVS